MSDEKKVYLKPKDFGFREWQPRIWHGMSISAWIGLICGHLGRVPLFRYPLILSITIVSLFNSLFFAASKLVYGRKIIRTDFVREPVFILGYWRSGTTWLNELLICNSDNCFPTTFQCFAPNTFVIGGIFSKLVNAIIPSKRPMDSVDLNMEHPQEDEFAILNLGLQTPYRFLAFPSLQHDEGFTKSFYAKAPHEQENWTDKWLYFLKSVQFLNPNKRLILKSPLHTARIKMILSAIPNAKFIHISRNPLSIIGSNQKAYSGMVATQSLERLEKGADGITEDSLNALSDVYDAFFDHLPALKDNQISFLSYEDLAADTLGELKRVYKELELGNFEKAEPLLKKFIKKKEGYQSDQYDLPDDIRNKVRKKWSKYLNKFGYEI